MSAFNCPACGKAKMVTTEIPQLETEFEGSVIFVPNARVSECPACGERTYSAKELKRWVAIKEASLVAAGVLPTGVDVRQIREGLGLSVAQFADLIGVTRQTIHLWEKSGGEPMKFSPASLIVRLLDQKKSDHAADVASSLEKIAIARGKVVSVDLAHASSPAVIKVQNAGALKATPPRGGPSWGRAA